MTWSRYTLYGDLIKQLPYFSGLDDVVMVKLASKVKCVSAMHGEPIMEEGRVGKEMYILVEGEVLIEKGAPRPPLATRHLPPAFAAVLRVRYVA